METQVEFTTSDGVTISGDSLDAAVPVATAIVCHPHPQFGGNRFNPIVDAVFRALPVAGITALRFDFRSAFDDGIGEAIDAAAALETVRATSPELPAFAVGYSFGALMALAIDGPLDGRALIAPPLSMRSTDAGPSEATLVLSPTDDQFTPADVARDLVATWPATDFVEVEDSDHFLGGAADAVAELVADWLQQRVDRRP